MDSLSVLLKPDFWKGIGAAMLRTFIAAVAPLLLAYSAGIPVDVLVAVSQVALTLIVAILMALTGLPQPGPNAGFLEILGSRFIRQFTQFVIAGIGTSVLVTQVPWTTLLLGALASALATGMLASMVVIPGQNTAPPSSDPVPVEIIEPVEEYVEQPAEEDTAPIEMFPEEEPR